MMKQFNSSGSCIKKNKNNLKKINTMKKLFVIALALVLSINLSAQTETKTVKTDKSKIVWKGYKVLGSHEGTIQVKSGTLDFKDGKLTAAEFTVDMTTLKSTDLEGEMAAKLNGHLKSDDFFGVETYKTSTLKTTKVVSKSKNSYTVTADLTIKGKKNPITFEAAVYGSKANATLKVDRTLYDIKYGSTGFFDGLGDKAIYDEFDLVVDLQF